MQVDLRDHAALVLGVGPIADAVAARLRKSGAAMGGGGPGPLDILVQVLSAAPEVSAATTDTALEAASLDDVGVAIRAAREALPRVRSPGGRVVFVTGVFGIVPARLRAGAASASAALAAFARTLAMEQGPRGILVNVVASGPSDAPDDARMLSHVPLRRPAAPEDAAHATLFLCAPASSYVTGHVLVVDGGWSAGFARDF